MSVVSSYFLIFFSSKVAGLAVKYSVGQVYSMLCFTFAEIEPTTMTGNAMEPMDGAGRMCFPTSLKLKTRQLQSTCAVVKRML